MRALLGVYNLKFFAGGLRPAALLGASLIAAALPSGGAPVHPRGEARAQDLIAGSAALPRDAVRTLAVSLIENRGQIDPAVRFYVQGSGKSIYFTPDGVTYALSSPATAAKSRYEFSRSTRWAVKLKFPGADPSAVIEGLDKRPGSISHFSGKPSEWKTGSPTYGSVIYRNLWPGIDLQFDANVNHIKYKFVVQPGADPSQIRIACNGAAISIDLFGQLALSTPFGAFHDAAPFSYQDRGTSRLPVASSYRIDSADEYGGAYGFTLGEYDRNATLVIDPSVTVYAGYIGGVDVDAVHALAVDAAGNAYVAGETASAAGFPTTAGPDTSFNGGNRDAFVAKISADGTTLLYAGFLGGAADDYATGIAIDSAGNAYVTGETRSNQSTFPVIGGPDLSFNGASDAFVAKINAAGTALLYSGYVGGAGIDTANAIAVDSAGNAYIAGDTFSPEATFPVTVGPDLTFNGVRDAFVAKVNASGSALSYAGYIGGAQFDIARAIAVDADGSAYVAGETASSEASFPVRVGPDLTFNGGSRDAFVAQVAPGGATLSYAGYVGGAGDDIAHAIAVNAAGEAFLAGETSSTEASFPILRGPGLIYRGGSRDAFAAKINAGGGSLFYSGYIGGAGTDIARAAALDDSGGLVVSGATSSSEAAFPVVVGPGLTFGGVRDAFASKVNPAGTGLLFSGYFGGAGDDAANAVALDAFGNLYLAGSSASTESSFPAITGPDLTSNGSSDAFVAKISVGEPHITAEGVVNAASYKGGPIAPGEIISIFGTAIGPDEPLLAQLDSNGRVATTLGSTTVFFGSDPGALFYVSDTQINVQAPYSIDGASTVEIRIHNDGLETNTITVPVAPSAPGIFTTDASGSGQAAAVDINGNLNTADNAVGPGDIIIIFATGEGQTNPAGVTGKLAVQPFPVPVLPVKLLISGIEAQLLYAGAAPGFAGLLQINAIVPAGIAPLAAAEAGAPHVEQSGSGIPVELIIGDESSQPDVFLNFTGGTGIGVPIADPQSVSTNEDTPRNITLTGGDPADQPLTFSILSGPANGSLSAFSATTRTSASLTYTPALNYNGADSFQFRVLDPDGNTASATVSITVLPVNDPPVAVDDSRSTDPGDSVVISVLANDSDPDNDPLTVTAVGNPANGTASTNGTTVTYTPNSGFVGTDTFSYTISDGALTASASISVRVRGSSNESPSAAAQNLMTNQGVPIVITLTGSDPDGDTLTYGIQSGPSNGTLSAITQLTNESATVTYTPNPTFIGIDQFTYVVTDGHGASSPGIITIQVKPVADLGITKTDSPDPVLAGAMLTYNIAVTNSGPQDAPGVVVSDTLPAFVTLVSATPSQGACAGIAVVSCALGTIPNGGGAAVEIVVTVNPGFRSGQLQNTATVAGAFADVNPANNSSTATTMIINLPPVIGNAVVAVETVGNTPLKVAQVQAPQTVPEVFFQSDLLTLGAVTDVNGDPLVFSVPSPLTTNGGGVTITNPATGEFIYTPPPGNNAPDSFTYQVADPGNPAVNGTVNITLSGRIWYVKNDQPGMSSGTSVSPFSTLADAEGASAAGDDIFVHFGDGTTTGQDAGITLKNNQRLIGEGVALDIDLALNGGTAPTPLFPAGTHPLIDNTTAASNGVTAADVTGIEVRGVNAQGTSNGIWVTCTTGAVDAVVSDNIVRFAGQVGLGIFSGGTCALRATVEDNNITAALAGLNGTAANSSTLDVAFNRNAVTVNDSPTSIPIAVAPLGGSPTVRSFDGNTVSGSSGGMSGGIFFDAVRFDADPSTPTTFEPVPGGATVIGDTAGPDPFGGPGMVLNNVSGNLQFTSLDIEAGNGFGLQASGTGVFTPGPPDTGFRLAIGGGVIHAQNGPALDLDPLTTDITFDQITSANSTGPGVALTDLAGIVTINNSGPGSSITGAAGDAFLVDGGNAAIAYGGSITAGTGLAVNILDRTGGSVAFGGPITSNAPGQGISITGGTAANTVNFNGAVNLGQTTPLTAVGLNMTGNHAATEVHFNATLNIATNGADGIVGTAAGILTTTNGAISATNGTALNIAGLDFGPASLNFDTVAATNSGAQQGINLQDFTGTANLGVVNLNTNTATALNLLNGGSVTTLPGSAITTTAAQAIVADNVDFGFLSLQFDSINASTAGPAAVEFVNTRGRANLMSGSLTSATNPPLALALSDSSAFELLLGGTTFSGGMPVLSASSAGTGTFCLSATGNTLSAFDLTQSGAGIFSVVQQDAATLSSLNNGATVNQTGAITFGQGCLTTPTSAHLSLTKTVDKASAAPGESLQYTIVINNAGPSGATGATIADMAPPELSSFTLNSCTPTGGATCPAGGAITGAVDIPAGGSLTLIVDAVVDPSTLAGSLTNTASITYADDPIPGNNTASATTQLLQSDLSITKSDSVDPVIAGSTLTYTVTVSNAGPDPAQNVVVTDTLPAGVTFVSTTGCAEDTSGVPTCSLGTIASGAMAQYTVEVTVNSDTVGTITNNVSVTSDTADPVPGNNSTTEDTTVQAEADLAITKSDSADPVAAGGQLVYTVTVTNNGPSDASGVVVTDTLPAGVSNPETAGDCAEGAAGVPICTLGTIVSGASKQYTITVDVDQATLGTITNNASVTSSTADPVPGNNAASEDTVVNQQADLGITKVDNNDPVIAGSGTITYTIEVSNAGPSNATNVVVTDTLPAGVTLVSTSGCVEDPNGVPTCTLGSISAGGMASYSITVNVDASASGTLTNTATAAADQTDPNPSNNTVMEGTTVNQVADLSISKSDSPDPVATGGTLTYTIIVMNNGPSDAASVVVADTLPAGLMSPVTAGCDEDTSGIPNCTLGTIAAGAMKQYTIMATVVAGPGMLSNTATVTSTATDNTPGNNSATAMTTVINPLPVIGTDPVNLDALGNTTLEVASTQIVAPSLFLASNLQTLAGVTDADPLTFGISGTTPPTNGVATITSASTGEFTYTPNAGATSDTFDVDVSDGFNTVSFTVNITTNGAVWYVKNDHNSGTPNTGTGTSSDPFTTLADADGASDGPGGAGPSAVGDIIYVFRGDGTDTNQDAGIILRDQQKFRGSGAPLAITGTFNGVNEPVLLPADPAGPPHISNAAGTTVLVDNAADGGGDKTAIEIAGFNITGLNPVLIDCSDSFDTGALVGTNTLTGASSAFTAISSATCGTNTLAVVGNTTETSFASGASIAIDGSPGGVTYITAFFNNSVTPPTVGGGISVRGAIFDADPTTAVFDFVNAGSTVIGASGDPVGSVGMILGSNDSAATRVAGELAFTDLDIFSTGTALSVAGSGVLTPASPSATTGFGLTTPAGSTLSSTSGAALVMDPLTASTVFDTANGTIVSLTDVAGVVNIAGGALTGAAGVSTFKIDGGNATVTYGGSATAGSGGLAVEILDRTGGSATFNGAVTSNNPGLGISVLGATATTTTTFNGNVDLGVTTPLGSTGVSINHNATASTTSFANLDIATNGAVGLTASNGGTLGITTGTVAATGGTAVNVSGTNTSSFTLASVTQSGAAAGNGINISNSTGTKNFTFASIANTSGIGVALLNAGTVNIDGMSPTSSISTTGNTAFSSSGTALGVNFASTTSTGGVNNILLTNASGSANFGMGALTSSTGNAFAVNGGSAAISYAGSITNGTAGDVVNIQNTTGGSVALAGNITDNTGGTGITVLNNNTGSAKTITFSGGAKTLNTGTNAAVDLNTNTNATISFTNGGLDIDTTTGIGFSAVGGGTINVSGANNTVTTTSGQAVDIDAVTTGITFASLSSTNSATHGVDLSNLGVNSAFNGGTTTITNSNATGALTNGALRILTVGNGANIDFGTTAINSRNGTGIFIDSVSASGGSPSTIDFGAVTIPNPDNSAGYGIRIEDSGADVTIASATISNTIIGTATTFNAGTGRPTNDGDGDGIFLKNNTGEFSFTLNGGTFTNIADNAVDFRTTNNVTLNGITIGTAAGNGTDNAGLMGDIGTNLSVLNSNFAFIGNDVSPGTLQHDNGMTLRDISGTFTIQNTLLDGDDGYSTFQNNITLDQNRAVELANAGVNLNVVVTDSTIRFWDFQGLNLRFIGGSMNVDVGDNTVGNANTFTNINGAAVSTGPSSGATTNAHTTDVLRNTFTNVGIAVESFSSRGGDSTVRIVNNTVATTISDAFRLVAFANGAVGAFPNYNARVTNNTVTGLAGGHQGMGGGAGFFVAVEDTSNAQVLIDSNNITGHGLTGPTDNLAGMLTTQHQRGGNMDITFSNNTASNMQNNAFGSMFLQVNGTDGANSQCINFSANTYTNVKPGAFAFGNIYAFDLTAVGGNDNMEIHGFVDPAPPGATEAEVAAYLNGPETTTIVAGDVLFFGAAPIGGTCVTSSVPPAP